MARLKEKQAEFDGTADEFSYVDPTDGSVSSH